MRLKRQARRFVRFRNSAWFRGMARRRQGPHLREVKANPRGVAPIGVDLVRSIAEGIGEAITVQDRQGRLVFANAAAARLIGFESVGDLLAASPNEILARFE